MSELMNLTSCSVLKFLNYITKYYINPLMSHKEESLKSRVVTDEDKMITDGLRVSGGVSSGRA